jgi:hypothetical protein
VWYIIGVGRDSLRRPGGTGKSKKRRFVKGTCGKPSEFSALKKACEENGYIYTGKAN